MIAIWGPGGRRHTVIPPAAGLARRRPHPDAVVDRHDRRDAPVHDGDPEHGERPAVPAAEHHPGQAVDRRRGDRRAPAGMALGGGRDVRRADAHAGAARPLDPQRDLGVQEREQPVEVTLPRRREEGRDDRSLRLPVARRLRPPDLAPGPAGQHLGGVRGPAEDLSDVGERHREHVVQHERQPLRRGEGLQHDEHRQPDGLREDRLLLRGRALVLDHDERQGVQVVCRPAPARTGPQDVDADTTDDRGQPAPEVVDAPGLLPRQPQPRLLQGVLGVGA
mgnify:CR=1 FL=1